VKLTEALRILQRAPKDAASFKVLLACGYTPLHMQTFLTAHLQTALQQRRVELIAGLYGDVPGTLARASEAGLHAIAVPLEWADLDPRLGFRQLGGWGPEELTDIASSAGSRLGWVRQRLAEAPEHVRIAVALPTTALPPVFYTPAWQMSPHELAIQQALLDFAAWAASRENVFILNQQTLSARSPYDARFDLKSELLTGLPYSIAHASVVAEGLANLIAPPAPKKGIITDLDDTFWLGLVGEVGHDKVCWDLANHAQVHGLYQQVLRALADQGVLVAIASKNSPELVAQALDRTDLIMPKDRMFPIEVHWKPKSESVGRILRTWNIGADSVVFVDDSPMEVAEVKAAYPDIECLLFPKNDPAALDALLRRLRDLFGKSRISSDDALRLNSIRTSATLRAAEQQGAGSAEEFLSQANAAMTFEFGPREPRVLELVNKTNQFNLNGIRYTEAEWAEGLSQPGAFVLSVQYEDKFGALGTIAVIRGYEVSADRLDISTWVMSCRAFSRRIEHQCLRLLFDMYPAGEIGLRFVRTAKNEPTCEFLESIDATGSDGQVIVTREGFERACPALYHKRKITEWTTSNSA
jgi:FkbH-like protein